MAGSFVIPVPTAFREVPPPVDPPDEVVVASYYVSTTGNDLTGDGSEGNPWRTINKAATDVLATEGGHTDILIAPGTYENDPIIPKNSGLSDSERIRFRPNGGNVIITGPSGSIMTYGVDTTTFSPDYVDIGDLNNPERITVDGWDGPGPFDYSQFPFDNSNIDRICDGSSASNNCNYYFVARHIEGGFGLRLRGSNNRVIGGSYYRLGTPDAPSPQPDRGDMINEQSSALNNLYENLTIFECGHTLLGGKGRNSIMRHNLLTGSWSTQYYANGAWLAASVTTLDGYGIQTLGNHTGGHQENTNGRNCYEDMIIRRVRASFNDSDKTLLSAQKVHNMEGEKCIWRNNFYLDNHAYVFHCNARTKIGGIANDHRIYHNIIDGLVNDGVTSGTQAIYMNTPDVTTQAKGWHIKNNVFMNLNRLRIADLNMDDNPGGTLEGFIFAGNIVPVGAQIYVRGVDDSGRDISWWETNYPANFYGNVESNDPNFVSANQNSDFSNVYANYTPDAGSPCLNAGVDLTNANGSGSNSISLRVDDAGYFIDARSHPDPINGPYSDGYQLHIAGFGNVGIQNVDYSTNTITLKSPATWAHNAAINIPYSGSAPDIGSVQT